MVKVLKEGYIFFLLFFLFVLVGTFILIEFPKGEMELRINAHHTIFYDYFFKYITYFGELLIFVIIFLVFLFKSKYEAIVSGVASAISGIFTQVMKRQVFDDVVRPKIFFKEIKSLYYVDGLDINSYYSFPSGHTSGAFTIFCCLALFSRNTVFQILCFFMAFMVGLSRVYLLQHFIEDVFAGACIGVVFTFITYYFIENFTSLNKRQTLMKPLFSI